MASLREVFAELGVEFDDRELRRGNRQVDAATQNMRRMDRVSLDLGKTLTTLAGVIGAVAGARALGDMVSSTIESTAELGRWSQRLNISTQEMYGWAAAARSVGGDLDDVTDVLKELQLKARDAIGGGKEQREVFQLLGISVDDLRPVVNDVSQLMELFTDRLSQNTSAATQNFVVDELLSDAGTRLLPLLRQQSAQTRRLRQEAERLGGRDMPRLAEETARYTQANARLGQRLEAVRNAFVLRILPAVTGLIDRGAQLIDFFEQLNQKVDLVQLGLVALGVVAGTAGVAATVAWGPTILLFGAIALAIGAVILIVDDLVTAFRGGESVIADFYDSIAGAGEAQRAIAGIKAEFDSLGETIQQITEFLEPFVRVFNLVRRFGEYASFGVFRDIGEAAAPVVEGAGRLLDPIIRAETAITGGAPIELARRAGSLAYSGLEAVTGVSGEREQARLAARRERQAQADRADEDRRLLARTFPDLAEVFGGPTLAASPAGGGPVSIEAGQQVTLNFNGITDTDEITNLINLSVRNENQQQIRNIRDAVERGSD